MLVLAVEAGLLPWVGSFGSTSTMSFTFLVCTILTFSCDQLLEIEIFFAVILSLSTPASSLSPLMLNRLPAVFT